MSNFKEMFISMVAFIGFSNAAAIVWEHFDAYKANKGIIEEECKWNRVLV
jgi:hypothetical protein